MTATIALTSSLSLSSASVGKYTNKNMLLSSMKNIVQILNLKSLWLQKIHSKEKNFMVKANWSWREKA